MKQRSAIIIACLLSLVLAQLPVGAKPRTSEPFGLIGHDLIEAEQGFCTVVSGDPASGTFRADVWQH